MKPNYTNSNSSKINLNKIIGDYGEIYAGYELLKRGYEVLKNMSEDMTDIIALTPKKVNIQVKVSKKYKSNNYVFSIKSGNHSFEDIDFFIFLGIHERLSIIRAWIIPRRILSQHKSKVISIGHDSVKYNKYLNNWKIH